jgi:hypothetical protein
MQKIRIHIEKLKEGEEKFYNIDLNERRYFTKKEQ